jgi:hypothetical protein
MGTPISYNPAAMGDTRPVDSSGRLATVGYQIPLYDPQLAFRTGWEAPSSAQTNSWTQEFGPLGGFLQGTYDYKAPSWLQNLWKYSTLGPFGSALVKDIGGLFSGSKQAPVVPPKTIGDSLQGQISGALRNTAGVPGTTATNPAAQGSQMPPWVQKLLGSSMVIKTPQVGYQTVQPSYVQAPSWTDYTPLMNQALQNIAAYQGQENKMNLLDYLPVAAAMEGKINAPILNALAAQTQMGYNTINEYTRGAMNLMRNVGADTGQAYDQAMNVERGLANASQSALAGANPYQGMAGAIDPEQRAALAAQAQESYNNTGGVLGTVGRFGVGDLAAQRAAAVSQAQQIPAGIGLAGAQALTAYGLGQASNVAKVQSSIQEASLKLAQGMYSNDIRKVHDAITTNTSLYGKMGQMTMEGKRLQEQVDIHNATAYQTAQTTNASNALAAARASTSALNAEINQRKYVVSTLKAMHPEWFKSPTAAKQTTTDANFIQSFAQSHFGLGKAPVSSVIYTDQNGVPLKPGQPKVPKPSGTGYYSIPGPGKFPSQTDWNTAVTQLAALKGYTPDQAAALLAPFTNFGYNGRDFDLGMQQVLQANRQSTNIVTYKGNAYIDPHQALALAPVYGSWVGTLQRVKLPDGKGNLVWMYKIPKIKG